MKKLSMILGLVLISLPRLKGGAVNSDNPFNPGYLGQRQSLSISGVTNFTGLFRETTRFNVNTVINYEMARKASLAYQFGYKSYKRQVLNDDWSDYAMNVFVPGTGWGNDSYYRPSGSMDFQYQEFSMGVKNYIQSIGSTAPFGGYLMAGLHYGIAKCRENTLGWSNYYSSSSMDTLPWVPASGVSANIVSVSYGFGTRKMVTDQIGIVMEMSSGLTLSNSAGVKLYVVDNYSGNYDGYTQQEVMTSVMLREIHKSQWIQFKVGLSYLF